MNIIELDGAAARDGLHVAGNIRSGDAAGAGGEGGRAFDAVHFQIARAGGGVYFRFGGDDDGVVNRDVVRMLAGAADANEIALLRNRWIRFEFVDEALAAFFGPGLHLNFAVDGDLAGRAGGDVCVSAAAGEFEVDGAVNGESFVEGAFGAGTGAASG